MESPITSVSLLQKAQDITSRWADGELGAEEAQHALKLVFDHWQQRGENCEELVTQLRWNLDPSKDGITDPALNVYAPQRPD
ncbi:hypothetical protein [Stutzerimonas chloritidismutans]|uniref:DUF3717 domain-containing protein n=1 Tax=Stutzerimonas chloritidismutans TaxID=203192 RepID=A0ABU9MBF7_STUCH